MTIYEVQNAQKTPIWKQRIIECRSSGKSVKEWCHEHGLDFTTYYRWERKILTSIIPAEDLPALPEPNLPTAPDAPSVPVVSPSKASIVKVELAPDQDSPENGRFTVNGFEFIVPVNISVAFLARLLEATKHAC